MTPTTTIRTSQTSRKTLTRRKGTAKKSPASSPSRKSSPQSQVPQQSQLRSGIMRQSPHRKDRKKYLAATEKLRSVLTELWEAGADDAAMLGEAEFAIDTITQSEAP